MAREHFVMWTMIFPKQVLVPRVIGVQPSWLLRWPIKARHFYRKSVDLS